MLVRINVINAISKNIKLIRYRVYLYTDSCSQLKTKRTQRAHTSAEAIGITDTIKKKKKPGSESYSVSTPKFYRTYVGLRHTAGIYFIKNIFITF